MAVFRAFKALRPSPRYADAVAALPYDVMSSAEARVMVQGKPYSFLHVDRAETDLPETVGIYDDAVYAKAAENLRLLEENRILIPDEKPCFYIYSLTMNGRMQTGLVGCASIDDYRKDIIKKHELTRADKEEDRVRHVDACGANTGPIFLTYHAREDISDEIAAWKASHRPVYDFIAEDGIGHTVWVVDDSELIAGITAQFADVPALYIADGHHRCASAVRVGMMRREAFPDWTGEEEFNYFLAVAFPDRELYIMDYNRVVADLNGLGTEAFLNALAAKVSLTESENAVRPDKKGVFGLYTDGKWYRLEIRPELVEGRTGVGALDVSVLQEEILAPVLGILDPRTDSRIQFVGGIRGLAELERLVDGGAAAAFSMYPTSMAELMSIADAGAVMPPKSTWFEPKLRSGLFIHKLS